ncbi:MAG: hypothetical protein JXR73_21415 [Candidatus Omnitrophica bacterium]|nr:hypothetical protein [Candidatus Omnitrophota bacterium]
MSVFNIAHANIGGQSQDDEQEYLQAAGGDEANAGKSVYGEQKQSARENKKMKNIPGKGISRDGIPKRDENAPNALIDLTDYYNAGLIGTWQTVESVSPAELKTLTNDLCELPQGIQTFDGVHFDIRGVVQLQGGAMKKEGAEYPASVKDIPIGQSIEQFHTLHATSWQAPHGTHIGTYVMHYENGDSHELNIIYGKHLLDWWRYKQEIFEPENTVVAWTGSNELAKPIVRYQRGNMKAKIRSIVESVAAMNATPILDGRDAAQNPIRLFKTSWNNPHPERKVNSIDYVSEMTDCAPFLVALTVE